MNSKRCFNSIVRTSQLKINNGLQLRKLSIPLHQSNYSSPFNQTQIRMTHTLKGWIRVTEREKQRRIQVYEKLQSKGAFEEWLETVPEIEAVRRDITGKKVRKYRKEGLIPAMIFGGPFDPILINVQKKDINKFVYTEGFLGRNYTIVLEGKKYFVRPHHCQLDGERYMNIVNLTFYRLDTPKAIRKRELEAENEAKQ